MERMAMTTHTIDLDGDRLLTFEAPHGRVEIAQGCAWLTEAGGADDTFLAAGQAWTLTGRPVVLGALGPARVRLVGAVAIRSPAGLRWWHQLVRAARTQVQRLHFGPSGMQAWR